MSDLEEEKNRSVPVDEYPECLHSGCKGKGEWIVTDVHGKYLPYCTGHMKDINYEDVEFIKVWV